MTSQAAAQLQGALRHSITLTELQHTRIQLRVVAGLLAGALIFDLTDPALLLLAGAHTAIDAAAGTTRLGAFGFGLVFLVLAGLLGPFFALQCGCYAWARRAITKFTCLVLAVTTLVWFFLAWRCVPLDVGPAVPLVFVRNGLGALFFSLALAMSLNAEQLRNSSLERPA